MAVPTIVPSIAARKVATNKATVTFFLEPDWLLAFIVLFPSLDLSRETDN
jgi:hypothetical protein